jgi:hypothetical protein
MTLAEKEDGPEQEATEETEKGHLCSLCCLLFKNDDLG